MSITEDIVVDRGKVIDIDEIADLLDKEFDEGQYSFEEIDKKAKTFWAARSIRNCLPLFPSFLHSRIDIPEEYDPEFLQLVRKKTITRRTDHFSDCPDNIFIPALADDLVYERSVKPNLPWKQIKEKLNGLGMDDEEVDLLIMVLKPSPLDKELAGFPEVKMFVENICEEKNGLVRKLSPLLKQLENLEKIEAFKKCIPLSELIEKIRYEVALDREIVKVGKAVYKKYCKEKGFDKDIKKSKQKHKFWNPTISGGLVLLNRFYHAGCNRNKCSTTHEGAIRKIAELLKILYPKIWKESVPTIANRIKQKDYRYLAKQ